jgi:hypothetical protein
MNRDTFLLNKNAARRFYRLFWGLALLQSLIAIALMIQTPSAQGVALLAGVSKARLALMFIILAVSLGFAALLLESWLRPIAWEIRRERLLAYFGRRQIWGSWLVVSAIVSFLGAFYITLLPDIHEPFTQAIVHRLLPLVVWGAGLSLQTFLALLILRHGRELFGHHPRGRFFYLLLAFYAVMFWLWSWTAREVIPAESQRLGWNRQGAPLVEAQVFLAWLAGLALLLLTTFISDPQRLALWRERLRWRRIDLWLSLLIWLGAVVAWQAAPISPNWFLTTPVYPNFEYYPSSDARAYDTPAQTALIGEGYTFYGAPYIRRSLLAMYMTVLHLLGGQDYERVVFLQILVLALIPVMIYRLTRALHNRYSALMAAALVIFREANSIRLAGSITTSNAKLLMADLPATLMALIFIYLVVLWLQNIEEKKHLALVCGGALGFSMLIRLETSLFFFPLAVIAALILWPKRKFGLWFQSGLLAALGILMVISPWVWRNYRLTGKVFIDHPYFQIGILFQRFHPNREILLSSQQEDETPEESLATVIPPPTEAAQSVAPQTGSIPLPTQPPPPEIPQELIERETNRTLEYIQQNIGRLVGVMIGHTLNSQLQTFLTLPTTFRGLDSLIAWIGHRSTTRFWAECCAVEKYVRRLPYWRKWDGHFPSQTLLPLVVNLLLIAWGANQAWKRRGWAGVAPIALTITYLTFNGIFRNSGGRYILPVDWSALVYFSIGLVQVSMDGYAYLTGKTAVEELPFPPDNEQAARKKFSLPRGLAIPLIAVGLLLLGSLVPLVERSFPRRYDEARIEAMYSALLASDRIPEQTRQDLQTYLSNGAVIMAGRALYPRYFPAGVGDNVAKRNPLAPRPYPRMVFFLAGQTSQNMAIPVAGKPARFPNGRDVVMIVCSERDILALALFAPDGSLEHVQLRSPFPMQLACPLPEEPADTP